MKMNKILLFEILFAIISCLLAYLAGYFDIDFVVVLLIVFLIYCIYAILTTNLKGNNLFVLSIFACVLFVSIPLLLTFDDIAILVSKFLSELKTVEYKSTYVEAIGSFLGSFLAITGALWLENRIKADKGRDDNSLNARIIYYDLEFAFKQIRDILTNCDENRKGIVSISTFKDYSEFHRKIQDFIVLIDDKWIRTVSSLPENTFEAKEREHIYLLYDHICKIGRIFAKCPDDYDSKNILLYKKLYRAMYDFIAIAPIDYRPRFANTTLTDDKKEQRKATDCVWKLLKMEAKILPKIDIKITKQKEKV